MTRVAYTGTLAQLTVVAINDSERNRLREIVADRSTYEVTTLVAADRRFVAGGGSRIRTRMNVR